MCELRLSCVVAASLSVEEPRVQEPARKGGRWVHQPRKIFVHYMTSWMALDVITAVPIDLLVAVFEYMRTQRLGASGAAAAEAPGGGLLQLIRVFRIVKLARIVRAARVFRRWQAHLGISFAMIALLKASEARVSSQCPRASLLD